MFYLKILFIFIISYLNVDASDCVASVKINKSFFKKNKVVITEKGLQSDSKLTSLGKMIDDNDPWLYAEKIQAYEKNGKIYILDGNSRVSALLSKSTNPNADLMIDLLPESSAKTLFPSRMENILQGVFDND